MSKNEYNRQPTYIPLV